MLLTKENPFKFVFPPVQEQIGPNYCDLFALAFATPLFHGVPPEERDYDQGLLRQHLHWMFWTAGSTEISTPKLVKTFLVQQWRKVASGTAATCQRCDPSWNENQTLVSYYFSIDKLSCIITIIIVKMGFNQKDKGVTKFSHRVHYLQELLWMKRPNQWLQWGPLTF